MNSMRQSQFQLNLVCKGSLSRIEDTEAVRKKAIKAFGKLDA